MICTGRSSTGGSAIRSNYGRGETIEETAELVTRLGDVGITNRAVHPDSEQVERLAGRIRDDHGQLDVLVNDVWGGRCQRANANLEHPDAWRNAPGWRLRARGCAALLTERSADPSVVDDCAVLANVAMTVRSERVRR